MWLILANEYDDSAPWIQRGLQQYGFHAVHLLDTAMLLSSVCWEHRLGRCGISISFELADGFRVHSDDLSGVVNRLAWLPAFYPARPGDREYASQEFSAFFTSWLYGLQCPVLNRATAQGLCGTWYSEAEWIYLSDQAGLRTRPYRMDCTTNTADRPTPAHTVYVIGHEVIAPEDWHITPQLRRGCQRLANKVNLAIAGLYFDDEGFLIGATPLPALDQGGDHVLEALAQTLQPEVA